MSFIPKSFLTLRAVFYSMTRGCAIAVWRFLALSIPVVALAKLAWSFCDILFRSSVKTSREGVRAFGHNLVLQLLHRFRAWTISGIVIVRVLLLLWTNHALPRVLRVGWASRLIINWYLRSFSSKMNFVCFVLTSWSCSAALPSRSSERWGLCPLSRMLDIHLVTSWG